MKRGDRGTIKFGRRNIRRGSGSPRNILFESISLWWRHAWAGGGASSPKEFQEFSSPRTEGNSSRCLDHFVPRSFYFPFLLLVFFSAADTRGITARKLGHLVENSRRGGGIEPRALNSNVIREQAVILFFRRRFLFLLSNVLDRWNELVFNCFKLFQLKEFFGVITIQIDNWEQIQSPYTHSNYYFSLFRTKLHYVH